jgi:DnaK suppressor protein
LEEARLKYFRTRLRQSLDQLEDETNLGSDGAKIVERDQQAIGRVSRMYAMQRQAIACAIQARRWLGVTRLKAALARLEDGDYGVCRDCGEDIPMGRLELDPTHPLCISCAFG